MKYSFASRRSAVMSTGGMVASSQPLATQVLLNIIDFKMGVQTAQIPLRQIASNRYLTKKKPGTIGLSLSLCLPGRRWHQALPSLL